MRVIMFSTKEYDRHFFKQALGTSGHEMVYVEPALTMLTASLASGFEAVCCFSNDTLDGPVLRELHRLGVRHVALRSAGFNQVDLVVAEELKITIARVPAYSPESIAEHTLALILTLNRKTHRAYNRVREGNFSLTGLMGFTLNGKTVGVVGTGRIGESLVRILVGMGCSVLAADPYPNAACEQLGAEYVGLGELLSRSDIVSLNCPLTPETRHLIDDQAVSSMKEGAMLINTSRGAVVDTDAVIRGLKSGKLGSVGLDVYEEEGDLFFRDLSETVLQDDVFARLLTFPNVLVTAHQAFFTQEAIESIAATTLRNIEGFATKSVPNVNIVSTAMLAR